MTRPGFEDYGKHPLDIFDEDAENLRYWLSRPVEERIAAVTELSEAFYGTPPESESRLHRFAEFGRRPLR